MLYFCLHPTGKASTMNSQPCYISCTNRKQIRHTTIHCNPCEKHQPTAQPDSSAHLSCHRDNCSPGTVAAQQVPLCQGQRVHTALETIWYPEDLQNEAEASELKAALVGWESHKWTVGTLVENGSCTVLSLPAVMALGWPWKHKNEAAPLLHAAKKDVEDC